MAEKYKPVQITDRQKQELEELVNLLEGIRGSHTELVSVLIPAGTNIHQVSGQLASEAGTAENIKSKATRTAVVTALETIIRELKNYKQTPTNGLAIYCGNVSEKEGIQDIKIWAYQPPKPLNVRLYRCDKSFVIEPLKEMLSVTEIFGLLVMDRREATIGILEGKQIKVLRALTSGVPGKIRAGGQCLALDTLIMRENGEIIQIKDAHNPLLIVSENFNIEKTEETPVIMKWENNKELFRVTTKYPRTEIEASKDHIFFVRTEEGIEEKALYEIKEGDYLLMPEKISLDLEKQKISFSATINHPTMREVNMPREIDIIFAKILGYYLGDGNYELDRISFSEYRKEVAEHYSKLISDYFKIVAKIKFRTDKGYYQIRAGSRIISQLFRYIFPEKNKTLEQTIPLIILKSPDEVLASFLGGFFDAEGYVSSNRIGLGINNRILAKQIQFSLLRLGIISSILEYDNLRNPYSKKIRYTICIDDSKCMDSFRKKVGFTSTEKQTNLENIIKNRSGKSNTRQMAVNGKEVARILRNSGISTTQFRCPDFFVNKKQMSKEIFKKRILDKIKNAEIRRRLEMFYLSNLIVVKISKIDFVGARQTVDVETKSHNFVANGLIVHNSAQRFERLIEGFAKEFFKRVAEAMKEIFFDMPKLEGIIIGGPIPTKEEFLEFGELVTKLKEKVIAVKDIGYTDEHGLKLLVEASQEDIAQQEFIKEKAIIQKFFETLGKNPSKAAYGLERVRLALERGAVSVLLISEDLPKDEQVELERKAENVGSEIFLISNENQEGEQFYNLTKGTGAILRFALE